MFDWWGSWVADLALSIYIDYHVVVCPLVGADLKGGDAPRHGSRVRDRGSLRISPHRGLRIRGNTHNLASMNDTPDTVAMLDVLEELSVARSRFPNFNSAHEGYAVLLEEVDELWDEVKRPQAKPGVIQSPTREEGLRAEAIQVAAMAIRFITDCCGK